MTLLSTAQIARLRTQVTHGMNATCDVYRTTGSPRVRTKVYTALACQIRGIAPGEVPYAGEYNMAVQAYRLEVPWNTTLLSKDEVVIGSNNYEIWSVADEQTPKLFVTAYVRRTAS